MAAEKSGPPVKSEIPEEAFKVWTPPPAIVGPVTVADRPLPPDPNADLNITSPVKSPDPNTLWEIVRGAVGPFKEGEVWPAGKFPKYSDFAWMESQGVIRRVA